MRSFHVDCVNEPFVHGLTRREADQVEQWEKPNELSAGAILPDCRDSVNTNLLSDGDLLSAHRPYRYLPNA